ncbi:MAG TPA: hypothetical protein VMM17_01005 [Gemmatimonadaceae bacterium]|nr:hypothetical protein [Gemmatimonadaceae bacterium]
MQRKTIIRFTLLALSAGVVACSSATEPIVVVPQLPEVPVETVVLHAHFDDENGGVGALNWTSFQHWNVVAGCVDLHGNGFHDVQAGNGIYVDLDGDCLAAGTLETKQAYDLTPGNYVVEFWLAGNNRVGPPDTVNVSVGTVFGEQIVMQRDDPFRLFTRFVTVTANTTARLRFEALGADNQGALLDQVRLRHAP